MNTIRRWFRTRWATLDWGFRAIFIVIAALTVLAVIGGDWFSLVSTAALLYIGADWQYWDKFGTPIERELRAAERRGQKLVSIGYVNGDWELYTVKPTNESDPS